MDGGVDDLTQAIRAHGNFVENVPFVLLAMALCELNGSSDLLLHVIGGMLIIGRILHARGLVINNFTLRRIGMILTFLSLFVSAGALIASVFMA